MPTSVSPGQSLTGQQGNAVRGKDSSTLLLAALLPSLNPFQERLSSPVNGDIDVSYSRRPPHPAPFTWVSLSQDLPLLEVWPGGGGGKRLPGGWRINSCPTGRFPSRSLHPSKPLTPTLQGSHCICKLGVCGLGMTRRGCSRHSIPQFFPTHTSVTLLHVTRLFIFLLLIK